MKDTMINKDPVYTCNFLHVFSFCDSLTTNFPIGFNTHFIAKQPQEAGKDANVNGA